MKRAKFAPLAVPVRLSNAVADEVVQLYVRALDSRVPPPRLQLRGMQRITLAPGRKKRVEFALSANELADYEVPRHAVRVEPGEYEALVGGSSQDIRARGRFRVNAAP